VLFAAGTPHELITLQRPLEGQRLKMGARRIGKRKIEAFAKPTRCRLLQYQQRFFDGANVYGQGYFLSRLHPHHANS